MGNISLLEKLNKLTATARPMKKWSSRYRFMPDGELASSMRKLTKRIKEILVKVSGDE
jgi:hypothetical protein